MYILYVTYQMIKTCAIEFIFKDVLHIFSVVIGALKVLRYTCMLNIEVYVVILLIMLVFELLK